MTQFMTRRSLTYFERQQLMKEMIDIDRKYRGEARGVALKEWERKKDAMEFAPARGLIPEMV